jgi:beta-1,2-mannobiose phosphorylase / 1,2-beta-oligomannan phosphorylase
MYPTSVVANPFQMERLGIVMQPDPSRPEEREGVLNPAAARGPDGDLYLFPRLVGQGNYSRIGIARVRFDNAGNPAGVERLGYALEPREPYELRPQEGTGGCEDPRVTYVAPLGVYVMAYVAWGPDGPRLALAVSHDLLSWQRLGLVNFEPDPDPLYDVIFDDYHNKNGAVFPDAVLGPHGRPCLALVHRPVYDEESVPRGVADPRPSIWLSYCLLDDAQRDIRALGTLQEHHVLINPQYERKLRIGGGTPPLRTRLGWLLIYHGVKGYIAQRPGERQRPYYSAGALVLDRRDVRRVLYRSPSPILTPETDEELRGIVPNVVFPTGIDDRGHGRIDVYYGMADQRIGVARLQIPAALP